MITARRMREKMEAARAGLPPPPPPRPESIPTHEHDRIVSDVERKHAVTAAELRARLETCESQRAANDSAASRVRELEARVAELEAAKDKLESVLDAQKKRR